MTEIEKKLQEMEATLDRAITVKRIDFFRMKYLEEYRRVVEKWIDNPTPRQSKTSLVKCLTEVVEGK